MEQCGGESGRHVTGAEGKGGRMQRAILAGVLAGLLLGTNLARAATNDAAEQQRVVTRFIQAYLYANVEEMTRVLPSNFQASFGPYPFTGHAAIAQVKVQANQALLEFSGMPRDPKFPQRGGILCYRNNGAWCVRQVLFYDHIPRLFNLPDKSGSADDRAQEAAVRTLGQAFLTAWQHGNLHAMSSRWFDWSHSSRDPIKGLAMSGLTLQSSLTAWHDPYVQFVMKLTYQFGPLACAMQVKGGLALVNEGHGWKVRGNSMILYF